MNLLQDSWDNCARAECFVNFKELNESQIEILDNIQYDFSEIPFDNSEDGPSMAYVIHKERKICFNQKLVIEILDLFPPIFLLNMVHFMLHEIIHLLFPELTEEETENKTIEWLNRFDWETMRIPYEEYGWRLSRAE